MLAKRNVSADLFLDDEGGFTTVSVAVSLLLVVVLLFGAAQVRWQLGESPDIQFVADSAALVADNVVADFYTIARVADAVVLSVSLLSLTMYGVAIVMCCVPPAIPMGAKLLTAAGKVSSARDRIADTARTALDGLQKVLPLLSMANATAVVSRSGGDCGYVGTAIPLPLSGEDTGLHVPDISDDVSDLEDDAENTAEEVSKAEEFRKEAAAAKERAYQSDCGAHPGYCMYQRGKTLASMSEATNPYYASCELWSFSVPLNRARAYYAARLSSEKPEGPGIGEKVRSECRKAYYSYAVDELAKGYVTEGDGFFNAFFPTLPANTSEMKETSMYTDTRWWVSGDGRIHGSPECPAYASAGAAGHGSLSQLDSGRYSECSECGFRSSSLGKVGAPSSSIESGFEYHYRKVAEEARTYSDCLKRAAEAEEEARDEVEGSMDTYADAMEKIASPDKRYNPKPPGRYGCIAVVADLSGHSAPFALDSSLMGAAAKIGPRVAISAAALAEDDPGDGQNLISSMLDGIYQDAVDSGEAGLVEEGLGWVLKLWGGALQFYSDGVDSLADGMENVLDSIPGIGESGLGTWAKDGFLSCLEMLGLQPAKLSSLKPLTLNTVHVLDQCNTGLADALTGARGIIGMLPADGSFDFETLGRIVGIDTSCDPDEAVHALDSVMGVLGGTS